MKFIIIASIKLDTNFQQKLLKPQRIHLKYQNNYIIINCLSWNVITREMFFSHFLFAFSKFSFKNRNSIQRQDFTKNIWYLDSALLKYDKKIRQKTTKIFNVILHIICIDYVACWPYISACTFRLIRNSLNIRESCYTNMYHM